MLNENVVVNKWSGHPHTRKDEVRIECIWRN